MTDRNPRRIAIPAGVLHQHVEGETVLLHFSAAHYYGLDAVGTRVWELLQEHGEVDAVVATLKDEYDVDEARLRADVERLLAELAAAELIRMEPGTGR